MDFREKGCKDEWSLELAHIAVVHILLPEGLMIGIHEVFVTCW
jgi:hypothetical protein